MPHHTLPRGATARALRTRPSARGPPRGHVSPPPVACASTPDPGAPAMIVNPRPVRIVSVATILAVIAALLTAVLSAAPAGAAGETVNIWLTTTNDSRGRNVTRGLQQQTPISFGGGGSAAQTI